MRADHAWYVLSRIEGLGPKRLHTIYRTLTSAGQPIEAVFNLSASDFQRLLPTLAGTFYPRIQAAIEGQDDREYQLLLDEGVAIVHPGHESYPATLESRLDDNAPVPLYCKGSLSLLTNNGAAIVGARHASAAGLAFASNLAVDLAAEGRNVISGYAAGIDTAAHLGALRADGTTTIVMSAGIREFAPKRDFVPLTRDDNVLVVSQFPPTARWAARNAMARNKLVCALAQALVVVEAGAERDERGRMSGTFDAGTKGLGLGIPVFVLVPDVLDTHPPGNTMLIERGGVAIRPDTALVLRPS